MYVYSFASYVSTYLYPSAAWRWHSLNGWGSREGFPAKDPRDASGRNWDCCHDGKRPWPWPKRSRCVISFHYGLRSTHFVFEQNDVFDVCETWYLSTCLFLSSRSQLETRGHHRFIAYDSSNTWSVKSPSSAADQRTSARPAFTTSPALDADPAVPRAPNVTQPRATAWTPLLPEPIGLRSSRSHHDFCAAPCSNLPSPSIHPEHCAHAAEPYNDD